MYSYCTLGPVKGVEVDGSPGNNVSCCVEFELIKRFEYTVCPAKNLSNKK